jgi:hypothetical protein
MLTGGKICRFHYSGEPIPIEVQERAELWGGGLSAKWRPWLSIGGAVTMVIGGLVMFYPMCGVLADFGVPEAVSTSDCLTSVVLMAGENRILSSPLCPTFIENVLIP